MQNYRLGKSTSYCESVADGWDSLLIVVFLRHPQGIPAESISFAALRLNRAQNSV